VPIDGFNMAEKAEKGAGFPVSGRQSGETAPDLAGRQTCGDEISRVRQDSRPSIPRG
jgi:hypothetical protein